MRVIKIKKTVGFLNGQTVPKNISSVLIFVYHSDDPGIYIVFLNNTSNNRIKAKRKFIK